MLGNLFSAASSLIGGKMASEATKDANAQAQRNFEQQQRTADAQRDQDYQRQEHFAKHGVQWRAADALQAGIHPLYALGGNFATYSGSPVTVGAPSITPNTSMGSAVASMGQDIGRAINSTRSSGQREDAFNQTVQGLTLQKMGLENTLLASQIKRLQANSNPPFPTVQAAGKTADELKMGGFPIAQDPSTSSAEAAENRYGEAGGDLWGLGVMYNDYKKTSGGNLNVSEQGSNAVENALKWLDANVKLGVPSRLPAFMQPNTARYFSYRPRSYYSTKSGPR